jgi:Capsule polysaccharide biosynthesis protein
MFALPKSLRRRKRLLGPLRTLHYRLWRATGVSGITRLAPELRDLEAIVRNSARSDLAARGGGPRILFVSFRAWHTHAITDALIAHALRVRGADVHVYTCGGPLPVCDISAHTTAPPMPCNTCAPFMTTLLSLLRLPHSTTRDLLGGPAPELDLDALVRPSLQWFFLSGNPPRDAETEEMRRRFLTGGALVARAVQQLLDRVKPDKLYLLNGIFFAEAIAIELARRAGIPFITHEGGFAPDTYVFARNSLAPHYPLDEAWAEASRRPLTTAEARMLDDYLAGRRGRSHDVARYYPDMESDRAAIVEQLRLDPAKPVVTLFTNIDWDTATFAAGSAFDNMEQWLAHTVAHFAARPERQLVVRIHPGEVRLPLLEPRDRAADIIRRHFPTLPENVRVVAPEAPLSSYTLMDLSEFGLVYTSTTGMEMALSGKTVVTAGRGYYAGKGFTFDARGATEYDALLASPPAMTAERVELARRYAFLFFFRHHIPFPLTATRGDRVHFNFDRLSALEPGRDRFLDLICDGILHGRPFLLESPA